MDEAATQIYRQRPWRDGEPFIILGPGGVGKSSLGRALSGELGWPLIDLDLEFCAQVGMIGDFIAAEGYLAYRAENLALADRLTQALKRHSIFVTASGFLTALPGTEDYSSARRIVSRGYGITLLPSLDLEVATAVVVERQLGRGFGFRRAAEEQKFRDRFAKYRYEGEALVVSLERPEKIADAVIRRLLGDGIVR